MVEPHHIHAVFGEMGRNLFRVFIRGIQAVETKIGTQKPHPATGVALDKMTVFDDNESVRSSGAIVETAHIHDIGLRIVPWCQKLETRVGNAKAF